MRLLWAAALVLPAFSAQAGVALTTLWSFGGFTNGAGPTAGLVQGSDGYFYGTTQSGGTNGGFGAVFKISPNGALTTLYSFTGGSDGGLPEAGLVQGSDGNFYGTTEGGGTNGGGGTVFKISANGALTSLYSFTGGNDGADPHAGLVQGSDGDFYGTTYGGGTNNRGTVFKISANGALTSLHSFTGGNDGASPQAGLVQGSDGWFYGTTWGGGAVFKISTNGALTSLYVFTGGTDGALPWAGLVQGSDGNFYGTTAYGGIDDYGTVFRINTNGALNGFYLTILHWFINGNYGASPHAGLVQGSDGNLYGTTYGGGANNAGTVFKISPHGGALTSLYSFTGGNDGAHPLAGLVQGSDGNFYGTTAWGGEGSDGTVFRLNVGLAAPVFQHMGLTNGTLTLTWSTEAGGTYQLQCNSDVSSSYWTNLGSAVTATGATLSATDSVTNGPQRFYRVVLSP
jgi:uncharacterized repeat protein (TIGR03803 family)